MVLGCTVAELDERISFKELLEWNAFERLTGTLDSRARADHHAALVASTIANANRGKRGRKFKMSDFMIKWDVTDPKSREQSPEQMLRAVKAANRRLGGSYVDADGNPVGRERRRRKRRQRRNGQKKGEGR
jgi:hypothetical protein